VNKIFYEHAVARNLYFDSDCHSLQFGYTFCGALCIKCVNWGYQNNDQSVSLISKWHPGITEFSIPDFGIENPIPGLQSLIYSDSGILALVNCVVLMILLKWCCSLNIFNAKKIGRQSC